VISPSASTGVILSVLAPEALPTSGIAGDGQAYERIEMGIGELIGLIIFGAVIGALARLVVPGKQAMGIVITILLGIAGALIGYWLWGMISGEGNADTRGIDWIRWVISVAAAVVLTLGYSALSRKK
jgi:uncharacterized membrane protein YeaQ/YmgE (transglycosylase-associated protein family)